MGTNYYVQVKENCPTCGHESPKKHIGKSSFGWAFALRIYPEEDIKTLADWVDILSDFNVRILDEYDRPIAYTELMSVITDRNVTCHRARLDDRCLEHGPGTYDYIIGDFS